MTRGDGYDEHPDAVLVADDTGTVVSVNPAARRLLGRSSAEPVGRPYRDVLPLRDEQGRCWWTCTDPYSGLRSRTRQPERRLRLPDGREVLVTAALVRDGAGRLQRLVVALRDDRARERTDRSRADLVSTVAHELRSPLTSVKGFTATLLARWDRFTDEQKLLMLATVNADADRVTRLLTELLDVSRIDAGRLEIRKQVVDLAGAARRVVAGRVAGGESPERFAVVVGELPEVWADPDKVDQVLGNLVENAVLHGAGPVTVSISGWEDGVEIVVSDEGEGIADDVRQRIFTRFWRGGDRRASTGLGLYVVKGLVEAHGGSVAVGASPSGGAAFRIVLPAGTPSFL